MKRTTKWLLTFLAGAIVILSFLALLSISSCAIICHYEKPQVAEVFVTKTMKLALTTYKFDIGEYPSTEEGLQALILPPKRKEKKWKGPYIDMMPLDPCGNNYQYQYPGINNIDGYDIYSLGPDGVQSNDDITNWKEPKS